MDQQYHPESDLDRSSYVRDNNRVKTCSNCTKKFEYPREHVGKPFKYCEDCRRPGKNTGQLILEFLRIPGNGILCFKSGSFLAISGNFKSSADTQLEAIRKVNRDKELYNNIPPDKNG